MRHACVTRPPRLRNLDAMRTRSSMMDTESLRSGADTEASSERRAKVKLPQHKMADQDSLNGSLSRARAKRRPDQRLGSLGSTEEPGSIISNWSNSSLVKPLFGFEASSVLSAESTISLFRNDDPWRAAKRGDLVALKQFHCTGKVDWLAKDEFQNTPLYYACQSGAINDIMVVPFLLWVSQLNDDKILEKCSKIAVNKKVRIILKAYKTGGLSAIGAETSPPSTASSRQSSKQAPIPAKSISFPPAGTETEKAEGKGKRRAAIMKTKKSDSMKNVQGTEQTPDRLKSENSSEVIAAKNVSTPLDRNDDRTKTHDSSLSLKKSASDGASIVGSLKSTLFGERRKQKRDEEPKTSSSPGKNPERVGRSMEARDKHEIEKREYVAGVTKSRLLEDDSSFRKKFSNIRKPPLPVDIDKRKGLPPHLRPSTLPSLFDERDDDDVQGGEELSADERSDWDRPIEQHRSIGRQAVKGTVASHHGRDDDSWSIGSLLSMKKWRNRNLLDPEKIDQILGTHIKAKYGDNDEWAHSDGRMPSNTPSFESLSHGAQSPNIHGKQSPNIHGKQSPKINGRGSGRQNFPKPYIEYHDNEKTWVVGNQWRQNGNGEKDKMLHVYDHKQRVHIVNCHGINIHIHGRKMKAVLVDNCSDINVIFDSVITTCEVVNCSNVGLQVTGLCPTFSIDTTEGVTIWLTREAMQTSNFVTSKSSEISISVPQSDDEHPWERKEVPLPVQYVHKFQDGGVMSHLPGRH